MVLQNSTTALFAVTLLGDIAVRNNTVSISKRALRRALSMMSIATESTFTFCIGFLLRWMILAGMCLYSAWCRQGL
jgi:hypothetical protein